MPILDTPIDLNDRIDTAAAAALVGVRRQTMNVWRCRGRYGIPFTRAGGKIYYSRRSILAWLESRTGTSTAAIREQLQTT